MDHDHHDHMMNHQMGGMNHTMNHDAMVTTTTETPHHGHHNNHDQMMQGGMMDHGMKMYFHASTNATILFEFWKTSNVGGMLGSCAIVLLMAALYEGLKVLRENLLRRSTVNVRYHTMPIPTSEDASVSETHKTVGARMLSLAHLIQTLLHVLQIVISYFLMLIFMTYNIYLCITVAVGAGLGYFLFGWKRAIVVDVNEHCH